MNLALKFLLDYFLMPVLMNALAWLAGAWWVKDQKAPWAGAVVALVILVLMARFVYVKGRVDKYAEVRPIYFWVIYALPMLLALFGFFYGLLRYYG